MCCACSIYAFVLCADLKALVMVAACTTFKITFVQAYKWLYTHYSASRTATNRKKAKDLLSAKTEARKKPNPDNASKDRKRDREERKRERKKKRQKRKKKKKKAKDNNGSDNTDTDSSSDSTSSSSSSAKEESSDGKNKKTKKKTKGKKQTKKTTSKPAPKKKPKQQAPPAKKANKKGPRIINTTRMEEEDEEVEFEEPVDGNTSDEDNGAKETYGREMKNNKVWRTRTAHAHNVS
jgi:hypothetical protein